MSENTVEPNCQHDEVGTTILLDRRRDKLLVTKLVGSGGMGQVFLAISERNQSSHCIKTIRSDAEIKHRDREAFLSAFRWESHVWIAMGKHENLVQAYTFDSDRARGYRPIVLMEYVSGGSLRDRLNSLSRRRQELQLSEVLRIAVEVLTGLLHCQRVMREELHGMPFVHRDIKPENILFSETGVAKVSDFGLVKAFNVLGKSFALRLQDGGSDTITFFANGNCAGTPPYMAPEQWKGLEPDERTDTYALGCVIFEMLTGRPPFHGQDWQAYERQHLYERPAVPSRPGGHLPKALFDLLFKCLAKETRERPYFSETREALQQIHGECFGAPVPVRDYGDELSARDWAGKGDGLTILGRHHKAIECYTRGLEIGQDLPALCAGRAMAYSEINDYDRAILDFDMAIELDGTFAGDFSGRGLAHLALGHHRRAMADLDRAVELDPTNATSYINRGNAFAAIGEYEKAIAEYDKSIRLDANYVTGYQNRGHAFYALGDFVKAISDYNRCLELKPKAAAVYSDRAIAHSKLGNHDLALADVVIAIELDDKLFAVHFNSGAVFLGLGKYREAISCFDRAVKLDNTSGTAFHSRGLAYRALGEHSHAISDFTRALESGYATATAYLDRGNVYFGLGDVHRAILDYDKSLELDCSYVKAYFNRGTARCAQGDYAHGIADFDNAIELDNTLYDAYLNRGNAYTELGDYDHAIADYSRIPLACSTLTAPDNLSQDADTQVHQWDLIRKSNNALADTYLKRGWAYSDRGDYDRAIADFEKAKGVDETFARTYSDRRDVEQEFIELTRSLELNKALANSLYKRGDLYLEHGDPRRAIRDYSAVLELLGHTHPISYFVYFDRGRSHHQLGSIEQAISDYRNFIELAPPEQSALVERMRQAVIELERDLTR